MKIIKYPVTHPLLKKFIKYYWVIHCHHDVTINHKLLPVGNMDLILNLSTPITYISEKGAKTVSKGLHFNGLRKNHQWIHQQGQLHVIGIALSPLGAHPFFKEPLCEFTNLTIDLEVVNPLLTNHLTTLDPSIPILSQLNLIETALLEVIDTSQVEQQFTQLDPAYLYLGTNLPLHEFCEKYGVHPRKLERHFNTYIGIGPTAFRRLHRFQKLLHQLINHEYSSLTMLAYDHDYYDQTHFLKDFSKFAGCSPSQFLQERASIKQIMI